MLVDLKFIVVSQTTGLYELKFVKLSALAGDAAPNVTSIEKKGRGR
jgi:hypothetical protein